MSVPFLDLKAQYASIKSEMDSAVSAVLADCHFIMGPNVSAFEKELAAYLGVRHVVTCASGSDALLLALMALGVGPGDRVATTPFTFFATAGAVARLGATPAFVDIDPATFNIDPALLEKELEKGGIKAVIPVHIYGQPCEMGRVKAAASKAGAAVIEDCAQSLGSSWNGKKTGSIGDMGCISFFPTKNLGCCGDGGAVSTDDDAAADRLRLLKLHGARPKYFHRTVGINSRLDEIQAAVLRVKLRHLDGWNARRRVIAGNYDGLLAGAAGISTPREVPSGGHIFHQYAVRVGGGRRDAALSFLKNAGIEAGVYYPLPLHLQECFAPLGYKRGDMPVSEAVSSDILSLPIFPEMTDAMIKETAEALMAAVRA